MSIKGVDLSSSNGDVDFAALQAAGVKFVLIRCGYGSDIPGQDDGQFFANIKKAKAHGMPYGVYLYSYALNTEEARSEARHALRLLGQVDRPAYGVWFDMEDADEYKASRGMPSASALRTICETFCVMLQEAGYYTGIYAALSWLNGPLSGPQLGKYDKWVAQWNDTCNYGGDYGIWQFTDWLIIQGKRFDGNYAYRDYPALTAVKEEVEMTNAEVKKLVQEESAKAVKAALDKQNPVYNTLEEVPGWAREDIQELMDKGAIQGIGNGVLGLTLSEIKNAVISKRIQEGAK